VDFLFIHNERAVRWFAALLMAGAITMIMTISGCGRVPASAMVALTRSQATLTKVRIQLSGDARAVELGDTHILALLQELLRQGQKAESIPDNLAGHRYEITFDVSQGNGQSATYSGYYVRESDRPGDAGYITFPEGPYVLPAGFGELVDGLVTYRPTLTPPKAADDELLQKYGFAAAFQIATVALGLPEKLIHHAGQYPTSLYWAYGNALSHDIGLSLTPYLGKTVSVRIDKVVELTQPTTNPRNERWVPDRAIIVSYNGQIVGAWLDRTNDLGRSLKRRELEAVTGQTWEEWVGTVTDPNDPVDRRLSALAPEEVIKAYVTALNTHDYATLYALFTRHYLLNLILAGRSATSLYGPGFDNTDLQKNAGAKLVSVRPETTSPASPAQKEFVVVLDVRTQGSSAWTNGANTYFFVLRQEIPQNGWRIDGIATSP